MAPAIKNAHPKLSDTCVAVGGDVVGGGDTCETELETLRPIQINKSATKAAITSPTIVSAIKPYLICNLILDLYNIFIHQPIFGSTYQQGFPPAALTEPSEDVVITILLHYDSTPFFQ